LQELVSIDWDQTLGHLVGFATSGAGKELLKKTAPLTNKDEAIKSFATIAEAQTLLNTGQRPYMESLDLYQSWFMRLEKNAVLKTIELKDIRLFLLEVDNLSQVIKPIKTPWVKSLKPNLMSAKEPLSAIEHLMTPSGDIRLDASETLFKLNQEKKSLANKVQNTLDGLVKGYDHEPHLQDKYVTNREGRWVIPVKSGMRHELEGIIHATSSSKQTVFMEPQAIVPLNNRIKQLEADIEKEVEKLLREISDYLYTLVDDFAYSREVMLEVDCYLAKAQFANVTSANPIEFSQGQIQLDDLKHPLMVLNGENVIPNTIRLNQNEKILILSGPNAGGKTVLLKAFGLASHMSRCGLMVCAGSHSRLPFFTELFVAVGDTQSVDQSLSTFAGHLKILDRACHTRGPDSLILIDEICGSTDPDEGAALARAFIQHYSDQGAFGLITSHLGPLKLGWPEHSGVVNGSMNYDTESGVATYEFIRGVPGKSLAFATAKKIGILDSVYNNAKLHLSPAGQKRLQSVEDVEKIKKELTKLRAELRTEIEDNRQKKKEYDRRIQEFQHERDERIHREVQQHLNQLREDLAQDQVKDIFAKYERRSQTPHNFPEVVKFGHSNDKEVLPDSLDSFKKAFPPGSLVFATSLNQDGIIQGEPNSKGEIPILSGSMRLLVPWENLKPPKNTQNPLKQKSKNNQVEVVFDSKKEELDLRGLDTVEAIEKLEVALDKAVARQVERIKIIHGHGTDSLKKAVRSHLSRSIYVSRWQASLPGDGGDGVTLAYLNIE
jgi:DNA mismatch repair protein MutS2